MKRAQVLGYCVTVLTAISGCQPDRGGEQDSHGGLTASDTETDSASSGETASDTAEKFDIGGGGTSGNTGGDCPGGMGEGDFDFSYIWIANSPEGTVSKINTFTGVEEGRYLTGPNAPDPSRTSVNQHGDVAVANRGGSITKVAAAEEDCDDRNLNGTIETSTGPNDVLPWMEDECVLWHTDLPAPGGDNQKGPRPIAWEAVKACSGATPRVWVGWWRGESDDVGVFWRLDGSTGTMLDEVEVPVWNLGGKPTGPYGGAVTADGDFWVTGYYGPAVKIDGVTLDYTYVDPPQGSGFYGMALGSDEGVWIGGCDGAIYHLPAGATSFETIATIEGRARGVQIDTKGRAWFAGNNPCRLLMVDTATKTLEQESIELPGCGEPVGISIDVEGYVWVVDRDAELAYKVDPETYQVLLTVSGLVGPYTYSDMTGAGLGLVVNPPQG